MKVQLVDPSANTPAYDHALAGALARAGGDVELVTSRYMYGPVPDAKGYRVTDAFYSRSSRFYGDEYLRTRPTGPKARVRLALKLAEHVAGMLRYRSQAEAAEIVHYQWLMLEQLDARLLAPKRPRVFTSHNAVPREPRRGQLAATQRLLERMDAIVVHSEHGAGRIGETFGIPVERLHVIPHGTFDHLTRLPDEQPLPDELAAVEGPVALFFGTLRPYKGVEVLLEAFEQLDAGELWVVGLPHLPLEPLRELAARAPGTVRFVPRFITDPEIPAYFRRADVVVLPYREIDQSGVLYTALAFGKAVVATSVGGFTEAAERDGVARLVPPEDPGALAEAVDELLGNEGERALLEEAARKAAAGPYSWDAIGRQTMALYERLRQDC